MRVAGGVVTGALAAAAWLTIAPPARADLMGVEWDGDVWRVDPATGAGTRVGSAAGAGGRNALARSPALAA